MTPGTIGFQPAIWPEAGISTEIRPYARLAGPAMLSLGRGGIDFGPGGRAGLDTYYNLFNLGKWRALCGDMPIGLALQGQGRFLLTVWCAAQGRAKRRLFSDSVTLDGGVEIALDLADTVDEPRVVLSIELAALTEGRLADFAWTTTEPPRQRPDLVVSVTTFRREAAVASTAARFRAYRAESGLVEHLRMNIVDNGQSLTLPPGEGVAIFPNANLGGAGGFARGMMLAREQGATHCLFMDDDASVHMRAITRSWMLLAYTRDPRTTVAGAMVNADHSWQLWENGAVFDRGCRPQYFGLDMRNKQRVLEMEFETTAPPPHGFYGGWWFFAFPLEAVRHLPFPFFVRGDDVSFSLANDLRIITLPGVASIQDSFVDKASPLTWYLDMRSHLAHHLALPGFQVSWWGLQRMFLSFYLRTALRFHYDSLSAVNLAIEDAMRGPRFFAENADMASRRADLKALTTTEVWQPIDPPPRPHRDHLPRPLRAFLLLTLNGHLLPFANLFGSTRVIEAAHRENFRMIYGARRIVYLNASRSHAYTVDRDHRRFFRETWRLLRNNLRLRRGWHGYRKKWQDDYDELTSSEFWEEKLETRKMTGPSDDAVVETDALETKRAGKTGIIFAGS